MTENNAEVVIVGGGAAGLSAALILARARRRVTVIDSGEPRNASAEAAHGLLGLEGISPLGLLARGRDEVTSYGGQIIHSRVVDATPTPRGFRLSLDSGDSLITRVLLIASGTVDQLPPIPGLQERWGRDVVHCPYCHGWEIRDSRIGLLATGPMSAMQALMFHQWSDQVQFFSQGLDFTGADLAKLAAVGIPAVSGDVVGLELDADRLTGVRMNDGEIIPLDALAVPALTSARLDGLAGLGLDTAGPSTGTVLAVDGAGRTTVAGVWAAGNVVNPALQISESAANGARVAMTINTELIFQDAAAAAQTSTTADV